MTARSVAISALLGYHPPELAVSALVRIGGLFGIAEQTMRVALTRMVTDDDATVANSVYRLTEKQVRRQREQEVNASPPPGTWDGDWDVAILVSTARTQSERLAFRRAMLRARFAELREGVWTRPANLDQDLDEIITGSCRFVVGRFRDDTPPVADLWDLSSWSAEAWRLIAVMADADTLVAGFVANAEVFRHLQLDPLLPPELLPTDWPGEQLRARFAAFNADYAARLREFSQE
ncbi:PaaX family transcriptional regulator C-terminal domain-containing protein [Gordonia sp. NB41Y]|uniref:PaaX family transcriptional regulator C-terminal domain-containing protein n=1 Tax=Gordonia sp. NB41Y TaxID=875808 RepID=UPI0006B18983|nr:PaaX family transcriptional regulator C-terminal domain-containing protein [Gordonia sp. NB41Y]WLP90499.1 PaaX family transcriptional regulator C-terminal domain-containing protein [Gordonia sp. NB41Y]